MAAFKDKMRTIKPPVSIKQLFDQNAITTNITGSNITAEVEFTLEKV